MPNAGKTLATGDLKKTPLAFVLARILRKKFKGELRIVLSESAPEQEHFYVSGGTLQAYVGSQANATEALRLCTQGLSFSLHASTPPENASQEQLSLIAISAKLLSTLRASSQQAWFENRKGMKPEVSPKFSAAKFKLGKSIEDAEKKMRNQRELNDGCADSMVQIRFLEELGVLRFKKNESKGTASKSYPEAPQDLNENDRDKWKEIVALHSKLDTFTHYDVLGIDKSAMKDQAESAYYSLVKKFHPDRLGNALSALKTITQEINERMTEALDTLSDKEARVSYFKAVNAGGGTPASDRLLRAEIDAAMLYQKAEFFHKHRNFDDALGSIEDGLALNNEEADLHALKAEVLFEKFGLKEQSHQLAIDASIKKTLQMRPQHERALMLKARILKLKGKEEEASTIFREISEANPKNLDALREVRLGKSKTSASGTFLGSLFGKKK